MKSFVKKIVSTALVLSITGILAACGNNASAGAGSSNASAPAAQVSPEADQSQRVIIAEISEVNNPFAFKNDDGEPDGYSADVFRAVAELLPQYQFELITVAPDAMEANLESGKVDIYAYNGGNSAQLASDKLAFGKEAYQVMVDTILVQAGDEHNYKTLDDFGGKVVYGHKGEPSTVAMEEYNAAHPENPIDIQFITDGATVVNDLVTGKCDGFVRIHTQAPVYSQRFGVELAQVDMEPLSVRDVIYTYRADEDQQLIDDIDGALRTLKENGKLDEIHEKWFFGTPWDWQGNVTEWLNEHPGYFDK